MANERNRSEEKSSGLQKFAFMLKDTKNQQLLKEALLEGVNLKQFIACAWIQVNTNDDIRSLAATNPKSVFIALLQFARMGLVADGVSNEAYLVRFGNSCVPMRGYKGLMRLFAENNPEVDQRMPIVFDEVREKDTFEWERGSDPKLTHKPAKGDRGKTTHYYAFVRWANGTIWPKVMSVAEVEQFKRYSRSKAETFWESPNENTRYWMRIKTVIRQLLKEVPMPLAKRIELASEEDLGEPGAIDIDLEEINTDPIHGDAVAPPQAKALEPETAAPMPAARVAETRQWSEPVPAPSPAPKGQAKGSTQRQAPAPAPAPEPEPVVVHAFVGKGRFCGACGGPATALEHEPPAEEPSAPASREEGALFEGDDFFDEEDRR